MAMWAPHSTLWRKFEPITLYSLSLSLSHSGRPGSQQFACFFSLPDVLALTACRPIYQKHSLSYQTLEKEMENQHRDRGRSKCTLVHRAGKTGTWNSSLTSTMAPLHSLSLTLAPRSPAHTGVCFCDVRPGAGYQIW